MKIILFSLYPEIFLKCLAEKFTERFSAVIQYINLISHGVIIVAIIIIRSTGIFGFTFEAYQTNKTILVYGKFICLSI